MNSKAKAEMETISSYERCLKIEIPFQELESEMESQFNALTKQVKIKGFRQGHVPLHVVRQQFARQVRSQSLSKLIDRFYVKAVLEHQIFPVSPPKVELQPYQNGKPVSYVARVEVKPAVQPKLYKGFELEREKVVIEQKEVDQAIDQLRASRAQLKTIEEPRGVQDKDNVVIDFKGTVDGKVFPGGTSRNFLYEMGSKRFVPGFEEGLMGMKTGEAKKIQVTFPKDFHEKRLASKPVTFEVTLQEIKTKEIPMLDDALAKEIEGCKTVEDVKAKVKKEIELRKQHRVDKALEALLLEQLVKKNPVEVPPSMIQRQAAFLRADAEHQFQQMGFQGKRLEEMLEHRTKDLDQKAAFDVKVILLSEAIAKKEALIITDKEIVEETDRLAKHPGLDPAKVKAYYRDAEARSRLKWQLLQAKVILCLLSQAKIREVSPKKRAPGGVEPKSSPRS